MRSGGIAAACVVIVGCAARGGGLFEGCRLEDIRGDLSLYTQLPYLVDWCAARIILVVALGVDQLGGNRVFSSIPGARWRRRRRHVMAIQVNLREGLGHSAHFGVLHRCRRAGISHCGEGREGAGPARRLVRQISERSRTYEQCSAVQRGIASTAHERRVFDSKRWQLQQGRAVIGVTGHLGHSHLGSKSPSALRDPPGRGFSDR